MSSVFKSFVIRTKQKLTAASCGMVQAQEAAYSCFMHCIAAYYLEANQFPAVPEEIIPSFRVHETLQPLSEQILDELRALFTPEEWCGQAQLVGWAHQYYQADISGRKRVTEQELPAATQFFTPEWLAKYLLQNSLGKLWAEAYGIPANAVWHYYLASDTHRTAWLSLEHIRILDPCAGTGHILIEAFDMLMQMYLECGYAPETAVRLILEKNLFGLELDRHACEIARFAVMMKAAAYDIHVLKSGIRPNFAFFQGETAGSLLTESRMPEISRILKQKYDIVATNPPYMGTSRMPETLVEFVRKQYPDSCQDLYACFMERCSEFTKPGGYCAMLTMHSWMFLSSFAVLREKILQSHEICSLLHLGAYAFEVTDVGSIVQSVCFVMQKKKPSGKTGIYINLREFRDTLQKETAFLQCQADVYQIAQEQFTQIPGSPMIYQASEHLLHLFSLPKLGDFAKPRQGLTTSDNQRFVRLWHEVNFQDICFDAENHKQALESCKKWFPYHKGGGYRKWYGNHCEIINYQDGGRELAAFHEALNQKHPGGRLKNKEYYFRESVTWTFIALTPGFRYSPKGFLFDVAGSSLFADSPRQRNYLLGFLCSAAAKYLLYLLNPTMNLQARDIKLLPYIQKDSDRIQELVQENINLCREDWDSFETSWNFKRHPLI